MFLKLIFLCVYLFSSYVYGEDEELKKKLTRAEREAEEKRNKIREAISNLGVPSDSIDKVCKTPENISTISEPTGCVDAATAAGTAAALCTGCMLDKVSITMSPSTGFLQLDCTRKGAQIRTQCVNLNNVKKMGLGTKILDKLVDKSQNELLNSLFNGFKGLFGGDENCAMSCKEQLLGLSKLLPGTGKDRDELNKILEDKNNPHFQAFEECLCSAGCYRAPNITKETCEKRDDFDCKKLDVGGEMCTGDENQCKKAFKECECQQRSEKARFEMAINQKSGECEIVVDKNEKEPDDPEFGAGAGDSFGTGSEGEEEEGQEEDDESGADGSPASLSASASGGGNRFNKNRSWKRPYRKRDGIKAIRDPYSKGKTGGNYSRSFKASKGDNKYTAKLNKDGSAKDIAKSNNSIFDIISKSYDKKVTANAFLFINEKDIKKYNRRKMKKIKRKKKR